MILEIHDSTCDVHICIANIAHSAGNSIGQRISTPCICLGALKDTGHRHLLQARVVTEKPRIVTVNFFIELMKYCAY